MIHRRDLLSGSLAIPAAVLFAHSAVTGGTPSHRPLVISTWKFGQPANDRALQVLQSGGSTLDAVEQGIRVTEASGLGSVGLSGRPNAAGYSQLDASIMHGPGHQAGAVGALEGIRHPISVARRVMEKTRHVMLAGEGARQFALREGFASLDTSDNDTLAAQWYATHWPPRQDPERASESPSKPLQSDEQNHDTITLLVLGSDGTISGGCSTSGLAGKLPGRVGDSPIIGSGLYVDNEVGAAGATGVGENVMRYCATFLIVEFMRQGKHPREACQMAIRRIASSEGPGKDLSINFIALDKQGRFGAAGTDEFPHAVAWPGESQVITANPYVPS